LACDQQGIETQQRQTRQLEEGPMAGKRELIEPHKGDKRYARRNKQGEFTEMDDVGRSLAADRRTKAKTVSRPGQGDKGDRKQ
jgi:hypothetical protein